MNAALMRSARMAMRGRRVRASFGEPPHARLERFGHARGLDLERAIERHRAREHAIAGRDAARQRLARERRLLDIGYSLTHAAVGRDLFARAHQHALARRDTLGRHLRLRAGPEHARRLCVRVTPSRAACAWHVRARAHRGNRPRSPAPGSWWRCRSRCAHHLAASRASRRGSRPGCRRRSRGRVRTARGAPRPMPTASIGTPISSVDRDRHAEHQPRRRAHDVALRARASSRGRAAAGTS